MEHVNEVAILEPDRDADAWPDTDDESFVPGQFAAASRALTRREIGFDSTSWATNLELEGFLSKPAGIKLAMDNYPHMTTAQVYFMMHDMRRACRPTQSLLIQLHPKDISLESRSRDVAEVKADSLTRMVLVARKEMIKQLTDRFFTTRPSDSRLVLLLMSKQGNAEVFMPSEWIQHGKAVYISLLRKLNTKLGLGTRRSPRKSANSSKAGPAMKRRLGSLFKFDAVRDDSSDEELAEAEAAETTSDRVVSDLGEARVGSYYSGDGGALPRREWIAGRV